MSQSVAMSVSGGHGGPGHHQGFNSTSASSIAPTGPAAIGYQNSPGNPGYCGSPGNPSAYANSPSNPTANTPSYCNSPGNQQTFIHSPGFVNSPGQGVAPNYVNSPGQSNSQPTSGPQNQGATSFCSSPSSTNNPSTPSGGPPNNTSNSNTNNDFGLDFLEGDSDLFSSLDSSAPFSLQDIL